jgi:signal transduction histidine kinase
MSLRHKFALLIGMFGLAVAGSLGAAWWSFTVLDRELTGPFLSANNVLDALGHIKRQAGEQRELLRDRADTDVGPLATGAHEAEDSGRRDVAVGDSAASPVIAQPGPDVATRYQERGTAIVRWLQQLETGEAYRTRIGPGTWRDLKSRILQADVLAARWFESGDGQARRQAGEVLFQIHEVIEKTELRILSDARTALGYGQIVRTRLLLWLGSVFLVAVLTSVLGVVLLNRWVQHPVATLRHAAARIAVGDFKHRVPVVGHDELSLLSGEVNHMAAMVHELQEQRVEQERLAAVGGMVRRLVHSLRNPLSGIRALAEVTRQDVPDRPRPRENLELIVSTVDTFEKWLGELLDSTSPAAVTLKEHPVRPWIERLVDAHRPLAQGKGIELVVSTEAAPETAVFDELHMDHALAAIITNAIEASPSHSCVGVDVRNAPDGAWEIRVLDTGPGIPAELRRRVFEPHFTTKQRGHGIGLAVAQQVLAAHGGRVSVEGASGGDCEATGACFVARLPVRPGPREPMVVAENSHNPN